MRDVLAAVLVWWLLVVIVWPEVAGQWTHQTYLQFMAGWDTVR